MDAKKFWLHEFIAEKRTFVIPVYQRNYDWRKENCEQLFNDIVQIIKSEHDKKLKPHFIGTFVYMENSGADIFRELVIIDGQQRITSIILFAKVLYDLTDDEELKEDIRSTFIKHSRGDLKGKCKLRPTEYDCAVFEKLMSDDSFDENNFNAQEKSSALYRNFLFFRAKINSTDYKIKDFFKATGKLTVVSIMLEEENPQEIFESLNSTGLDLTKADLIRNFLLMPLEYKAQEELYKKYWLEIENLLRPSNNMENFMIQYLISKLKSQDAYSMKVNSANLYSVFKRYFTAKCNDTENCFRDMLHYARYFYRVLFNDDTKYENLSALDQKFFDLTFRLDAGSAPIILMYLLDRYESNSFDSATFIEFIDVLISLTMRAKICGNSGITPQFAGNVLARLDKEPTLNIETFWRVVTFGKGRYTFPNDKDFQSALTTGQLYKARESTFCKYVLYSLEKAAHPKELPSYSEATVEHILPQKLNDAWKKYLKANNDSQTYEIWLHTLGNLTLTAYNSELSNADFDSKKEIYSQSNYYYTRALKDFSEWTSKEIQARAKKLAASAIKIWTLPEEFNSRFINVGDTFNLDSDFGALTGTKPATVLIAETEIKISNWIDLVREVAKQLYSLDSDVFRRAVQKENVPRRNKLFSNESHNLQKPFEIDENYYMENRLCTEECLRIVKVIVENFDNLSGTNFREDIYFTLRRS